MRVHRRSAAVTSLRYDRDVKLPVYAEAGIPEVWIVDLRAEEIHVCREPSGTSYRRHDVKRSGDSLGPQALTQLVAISVDAVLGRERIL